MGAWLAYLRRKQALTLMRKLQPRDLYAPLGTRAMAFFKGVGGSSLRVPFRTGLAQGRVRFVGEPVVLVVAETENIAQDAAELIAIEYEDLPVFVEARDAIASGAMPLLSLGAAARCCC